MLYIASEVPTEFVGQSDAWRNAPRQLKAESLAIEWLTLYEGDDVGPLSRWPFTTWALAFAEVGCFHVLHETIEHKDGTFSDFKFEVALDHDPGPAPDLFRSAAASDAVKLSWTDSMGAAAALSKKRGIDSIWRTRSPLRVFAVIDTVKHDETTGEAATSCEWVVVPSIDILGYKLRDVDGDSSLAYPVEIPYAVRAELLARLVQEPEDVVSS